MAECKEEVTTTGDGDAGSVKEAVRKALKFAEQAAEGLCPDECPPKRKPNTPETASGKEVITPVPPGTPGHPGGGTVITYHGTATATYICTPK